MSKAVGFGSLICGAMTCLFVVSSAVLVLLLITRNRREREDDGDTSET